MLEVSFGFFWGAQASVSGFPAACEVGMSGDTCEAFVRRTAG